MGLIDVIRRWSSSFARPPFERTVCACEQCVSFCTKKPGALIPSDIPRIAERLTELGLIEHAAHVGRFLRSVPPTTIRDTTRGTEESVAKIVPARDRNGRCVFLDAEDRCRVHGVSPFGCAYFDAHMDAVESERRKVWSLQLIRLSRDYQTLRATLAPAERSRPGGQPWHGIPGRPQKK